MGNTTIPGRWIQCYKDEVLVHLKSISDFIIPGEGVWYQKRGTDLYFFDHSTDPQEKEQVNELSFNSLSNL